MRLTLNTLRFPRGSTVEIYASNIGGGGATPGADRAPAGTPITSVVIPSSGRAVVDGLEPDTSYWAVAQVDGGWRWVAVRTEPSRAIHYSVDDPEDQALEIDIPADQVADIAVVRKNGVEVLTIDKDGVLGGVTHPTGDAALYFNVKDYGARGDGAADDLAGINAAFAAASAWAAAFSYTAMCAVVFFPAGIYKISGPIVNTIGYAGSFVSVQGAGVHATRIVCATDFGAGVMAFPAPAKVLDGGGRYFIRDLTLTGVTVGPNVLGVSPCQMDGLEIPGGGWGENLDVSYFRHGITGYNDHWHLYNVNSRGSYINLWWDTDHSRIPGTGDQHIEACNFSSAHFASMGLSKTQSLQGASFVKSHFGFAPIGIWGEAMGGDPLNPMSYVSYWFGCAFESVGNAMIYSEDKLRAWGGATYAMTGPSGVIDSNFTLGTYPHDYTIVCGALSNNVMLDAASAQMLGAIGAIGAIDASAMVNNYFAEATLSWLLSKFAGGKIWINPACDIGTRSTGDTNRFGGGETEGTFLRCGAAVSQWHLVDYDAATGPQYGRVVEHVAGGGGIIRGIAAVAGTANDIIPVIERGSARAFYDAAYFNGGGDRIKPSESVNGKITTAGGSELGVLGMSRYNAPDTSAPGEVTLLGGTLGFVKSSAYTQTYSTTSRTHPNATVTAPATTAATNTTPYGYTTQAQADAIVAAINANIADILAVKKLLNAVIDDLQAARLLG